jgi:hypothetical protein
MRKWLSSSLLILSFVGLGVGYYVYQKPLKSLRGERPDFSFTAKELYDTFQSDEQVANEKYLGRLIVVDGNIQDVFRQGDRINVILQGGVICEMDPRAAELPLRTGQRVRIKGVCSGVLLDVVLVRCILVL